MTPKQEAFAREYLIDLNATQAAIRAGYSAKTAMSQGERLLRNVEVSRAIMAAQQKRVEKAEIDAEWVLRRLDMEASADLADLYGDKGELKPVREWPLIWRQGLVQGIDVEEIREDGVVVGTIRKVKISDRIKRIELLGKHINVMAFRERVEHTGKDGASLAEEAAAAADRIAERMKRLAEG